jgi:predicted secreted protein
MMTRPLTIALLSGLLLASCRSGCDQPTTVSGMPAISPLRRVTCRIREDVAGGSKAGTDIVMLDKSSATSLKVGDTLRLELKAASGTGYQWAFVGSDADPSAATSPLRADFDWRKGQGTVEALEPGKPGGPALWIFEFKASNAGSMILHFALGRPWEKNAPADTRQLTVTVTPRN